MLLVEVLESRILVEDIHALPLREDQRAALSVSFTTAVRAIMKGSIVVAIVQGTLGGAIFWLLDIRAPLVWGAVMMIFALLPVIGTGLIWGPAAIYLLRNYLRICTPFSIEMSVSNGFSPRRPRGTC